MKILTIYWCFFSKFNFVYSVCSLVSPIARLCPAMSFGVSCPASRRRRATAAKFASVLTSTSRAPPACCATCRPTGCAACKQLYATMRFAWTRGWVTASWWISSCCCARRAVRCWSCGPIRSTRDCAMRMRRIGRVSLRMHHSIRDRYW